MGGGSYRETASQMLGTWLTFILNGGCNRDAADAASGDSISSELAAEKIPMAISQIIARFLTRTIPFSIGAVMNIRSYVRVPEGRLGAGYSRFGLVSGHIERPCRNPRLIDSKSSDKTYIQDSLKSRLAASPLVRPPRTSQKLADRHIASETPALGRSSAPTSGI